MSKDLYCPMIHCGLNLNLKQNQNQLEFNQCCLSTEPLENVDLAIDFWSSSKLKLLRETNNQNKWHKNCWQCKRAETLGSSSFRLDMINKLGIKKIKTGPKRFPKLQSSILIIFDKYTKLELDFAKTHPQHTYGT